MLSKVWSFQKSRRNRDPSTLYLQPPISPLFPWPSLFVFVGEDNISAFCGYDFGASYQVIGHAQSRLKHALKP